MNILVYLPSAQALSFENCEILVDDVNLFIFTYISKNDNLTKRAKFFTKNMVGYATFPAIYNTKSVPEPTDIFKDYLGKELKSQLEKEPPEIISSRDMRIPLEIKPGGRFNKIPKKKR